MKKKGLLSTVAYLGLSLCLCGGMIAYTGPADVSETEAVEQVAQIEVEDVVEGPGFVIEIPEEEVPLGAPKVTTKVSTKTSTTKTNMAKAATKTSKTTTTNTKKTTKTTTSASKKTVVETTVLTTKVTSTTKKSKVKTVKTTVKTTTKTTETQLASTTTTVVATTTSQGFAINSFADMNGKIDAKIYNAFNKLGFKYVYDKSLSSTGVFSVKNHWIKLKVNNGYYMMHELGHFVSSLKGGADSTAEWKNIYAAEKSKYTGSNKAYVTSTASEYFAEAYRDYNVEPAKMQQERPQTYAYVKKMVTSITDKDVAEFDDTYSIFW